ncbi:phage protease [Pontiellaceae bacterium B12227]|nr:phage protease [Pontiellaceae bacterium B12227]
MNFILNRNFELPEDDWYQLAPLGEFPHRAAGINQVIDAEACTRMVGAFENARRESENFPGLLIDFDHFSLDAEKHSEAAGWITDLQFRESEDTGGLFANIRWSDIGETAVKGGRYRFLSPVWAKADCEDLGDNRLRPVRLLNAAVTNDPNLKGILPLSNRASDGPFENASSYKDPNLTQEELMKAIVDALLKKLDLPPEADTEVIQSAIENITPPGEVEALLNRAETAESKIADLEKAQLEADADAFLEEHADVIDNREEVRTQFIENRQLTEAVFKNLKTPEPVKKPAADTRRPLHNRDSKIKATHNRDAQPESEAHAVKIRNRASEIMKTESVGYPDAFRRAEQELMQ